MSIIWLVLTGALVGFIARLLLPGRDPIGLTRTALLGVLGALIGGYVWRAIFGDTEGVEFIAAVITAVILLWLYRRVTYGRATGL